MLPLTELDSRSNCRVGSPRYQFRLWPEWIAADTGPVERVHGLGKPVWVTAGTLPREGLDTLIRRGVNGILTDLPEVLAPLVAEIKDRPNTRALRSQSR